MLAVASLILVMSYLHGSSKLSPIDELQHYDYVEKAPHIPRSGEPDGQDALRTEACRGIYFPFDLPPCDSATFDPLQFQENGRSTAAIHPPPYYFITAAIARPLSALTDKSLYISARAVGALWLFAGLWVTWCAGRRLKAPPAALLGMLLLTASSTWVWFSSGNVTPDATALLVGGGALWLAVRWDEPRKRIPALVLAAVLSVMFKVNQILAIAPVCTFLIVEAVLDGARRRRAVIPAAVSAEEYAADDPAGAAPPPDAPEPAPAPDSRKWQRNLGIALIPAAVAVVLVFAWNRIVKARTIPGTEHMASFFPADGFGLKDALATWHSFFPPNANLAYFQPILGDHPLMKLTNSILAGTFVVACLYVAVSPRFTRRIRVIAGSTFAWMLLGGPLYTLAIVVMLDQLLPQLPPRYGLVLMAPLAIISAVAITSRRMQMIVLGFGAFYVLYTVLIAFRPLMTFA